MVVIITDRENLAGVFVALAIVSSVVFVAWFRLARQHPDTDSTVATVMTGVAVLICIVFAVLTWP